MNVGILLFDDVQLTDFTGPYDTLIAARDAEGYPVFNVFTLSAEPEVRCNGGLVVHGQHRLDNHPVLDILLIPGGYGTRREENNPSFIDWIRDAANRSSITATVCTGARLMARTGLWDGLSVTTHWNSIDYLRSTFPALNVVENVRFVDTGKFLSSAGVSAGIDLGLHLVSRIVSPEESERVARLMAYETRAD